MDFFTVPTLTFNVLYCFFIISHDRRRILHFNVTPHPTSTWIVQQMREAFPYESTPKFLIFDHDAKNGLEVPAAIRSMKIGCVQTSVQCPWQNGVAERWVGSCRRELLDQVIPLNERHLKCLLSDYRSYYHDDRTHLGLENRARGQVIDTAGVRAFANDRGSRKERGAGSLTPEDTSLLMLGPSCQGAGSLLRYGKT
jgi:putative transposase